MHFKNLPRAIADNLLAAGNGARRAAVPMQSAHLAREVGRHRELHVRDTGQVFFFFLTVDYVHTSEGESLIRSQMECCWRTPGRLHFSSERETRKKTDGGSNMGVRQR